MESEVMEGETPIVRVRKWKNILGKSLVGRGSFPKYSVLARECVSSWNKTKNRDTSPKIKGTSK
jgi:hypothetical protein